MGNTSSWDNVKSFDPDNKKKNGKREGDLFMKLEEGNHQIRLVGPVHTMLAVWANNKRYVIPADLKSRVEQAGYKVRDLYAINIFDRADSANSKVRFKILEKGSGLFGYFKNYHEQVKIDPAGNQGTDWSIKVVVPNGNKRATKYITMPMMQTKFNAAETALIKRKPQENDIENNISLGERGLINLKKIYDEEKARKLVIEELLGNQVQGGEKVSDFVNKGSSEDISFDDDSDNVQSFDTSNTDDENIDDALKDVF